MVRLAERQVCSFRVRHGMVTMTAFPRNFTQLLSSRLGFNWCLGQFIWENRFGKLVACRLLALHESSFLGLQSFWL